MAAHHPLDSRVHHALLRHIIATGHAPTTLGLAEQVASPAAEVASSLVRLAENHGLVLHPDSHEVWVVHPFSLSPTQVWVTTRDRGWWAPCLWCALGVAALVGGTTVIRARIAGEHEDCTIHVREGEVAEQDLFVHFSLRPAEAWRNVIHYCATVLPFRQVGDVDPWCARHRLPRGALVPIAQLNTFARLWYGRHLDENWRKWSVEEARALFVQAGLTGPFWDLPSEPGRF
jgi:hypothetical protein